MARPRPVRPPAVPPLVLLVLGGVELAGALAGVGDGVFTAAWGVGLAVLITVRAGWDLRAGDPSRSRGVSVAAVAVGALASVAWVVRIVQAVFF